VNYQYAHMLSDTALEQSICPFGRQLVVNCLDVSDCMHVVMCVKNGEY
jgi:hypothetical protein